MDSDELKALQAPLKSRYREAPGDALVTLKAEGRIGEGIEGHGHVTRGPIRAEEGGLAGSRRSP